YVSYVRMTREYMLYFFFSSRRRHTRFSRDWSSDVCSSDLEVTVFSDDPLDEAALREAVDEAGYEVASLEVQEDALAAQYAEQAAEKQEAHSCACGCGTAPSEGSAPATKTYDLQVPPRA